MCAPCAGLATTEARGIIHYPAEQPAHLAAGATRHHMQLLAVDAAQPTLDECQALLTAAKRNCTGTCGKCIAALDGVARQCVDGCSRSSTAEGATFLTKFNTYRLVTIGDQCYRPHYTYSSVVDIDCGENVRRSHAAPPPPLPPFPSAPRSPFPPVLALLAAHAARAPCRRSSTCCAAPSS